jgi:hypothetical protein
MLLLVDKVLNPIAGHPQRADESDQGLNISVVFTSAQPTLVALRKAAAMASSLGARIMLLAPQVVPYPLPLQSPPVLIEWNERRFHSIANESPVETIVRLYLCRDRIETLKHALSPNSIVVIGGHRRWSPFTSEKRLARSLRRAGHEIIYTETE